MVATPVKPLRGILLTLAIFGGFPLDSVDDWSDCIWFEVKWALFGWCCIMSALWYIIPIAVVIILLQVNQVWLGATLVQANSGYQNATLSLYGVPPGDVNAFYWSLMLSVLQASAFLVTFLQVAPALTTLNSDIDNLAHYTMTNREVVKITSKNQARLALCLLTLSLIFSATVYTSYHRYPKVEEIARVFVAIAHGLFLLAGIFPPPVLAGFLLSLQYLEYVSKLVSNYQLKILPPKTGQGRLLRRSERISLPDTNIFKNPIYHPRKKFPPAYRSKTPSLKHRPQPKKKGSLPSYHSTVASDPKTMRDIISIIDYGFDTLKIIHETNDAFGGFLLFEVLFSFPYSCLMLYLTHNLIPAFWSLGTTPVLFKVIFALRSLACAVIFIYRLCILFNLGQKLETNLARMRKNLQDVVMAKFNRLSESQMYEISVLVERCRETRGLKPRNYFPLNNSTLAGLFLVIFVTSTVLFASKYIV